jgi:hypothetical protein
MHICWYSLVLPSAGQMKQKISFVQPLRQAETGKNQQESDFW